MKTVSFIRLSFIIKKDALCFLLMILLASPVFLQTPPAPSTSEATDTTETVNTTEPKKSAETAETTEPKKSTETAETTEPKKSVETAETTDTITAVEPQKPVLPTDLNSINITFKTVDLNDEQKRFRQTLLYGTIEQVTSIVGKLDEQEDTSLNNELFNVLKDSRNYKLQTLIYRFFNSQKEKKIEPYVQASLAQYLNPDAELYQYADVNSAPVIKSINDVVNAQVSYLATIESKESVDLLFSLAEEQLPPAIVNNIFLALSTLGDKSHSERALSILDNNQDWDNSYSDAKGRLILALGEWEAPDAIYSLESILQDTASPASHRWYSAYALGQIAAPESLSLLEDLFNSTEGDPTLSRYLLSGIGAYNTKESRVLLIEGLRSSNEEVRLVAIEQIKKTPSEDAFDALFYKAQYDNSTKVKYAAVKALGAYSLQKDVDEFLNKILANETATSTSRIPALNTLLETNSKAGVKTIETLLKADYENMIPYDKNNLERILAHFLKYLKENETTQNYDKILNSLRTYPNEAIKKQAERLLNKIPQKTEAPAVSP